MYQRATGTSLVASAFYDRFTPELVRFLRGVVGELCWRLAEHEPVRGGVLSKFADVVVTDATVLKLYRLLAGRYPGTRTNSSPAAAKLHLVMSVKGKGMSHVKFTGERANDHRTLRMGRWVRDRLLLFDLGYFRYQLFDCIDRNGSYFLTRLPASNPPTDFTSAPTRATCMNGHATVSHLCNNLAPCMLPLLTDDGCLDNTH